MTYSVDELFRFEETEGGYSIAAYLQSNNKEITELSLPEKYNAKQVVKIGFRAFNNIHELRRVYIPDTVREIGKEAFFAGTSLESVRLPRGLTELSDGVFHVCRSLREIEIPEGVKRIGEAALNNCAVEKIIFPKSLKRLSAYSFAFCGRLTEVVFNSAPSFGSCVFFDCKSLPADITLMSLVRSTDVSCPFDSQAYKAAFMLDGQYTYMDVRYVYARSDVFELAAKNDCFRTVDAAPFLEMLIEENKTELLPIAEKHGMLNDGALVERLLEYGLENGNAETTAYLLDLKKRKFGFDKEDDYDL